MCIVHSGMAYAIHIAIFIILLLITRHNTWTELQPRCRCEFMRNVWEREWKWQVGNGVILYLSTIRLAHTQIFRCAPLSVHPSCLPPVTSAEKARCTGWPSSPPSSRFRPSQRPSPLYRKWTLPFCPLLPPAALSAALWTGPRGGERWERLDRRRPQTVDRAGQTRRRSDPCPGQHCWRRWSRSSQRNSSWSCSAPRRMKCSPCWSVGWLFYLLLCTVRQISLQTCTGTKDILILNEWINFILRG